MKLLQKIDALGMTLNGLGRALGCSGTTVRGWCRNNAAPAAVERWIDACLVSKPSLALRAGRPNQKETANG